ncbi:hypothetical protein LTR66_002196 [Elasticomyces elasticus]|nr:hypothetical protein LTR66_002196 [Elasticomyces elasticus]
MSVPNAQTIRRYVLTISVAAITATGAWYGAGLKTRQELKQKRKSPIQPTPKDMIPQLEDARARLLQKKLTIEKKIEELLAKQQGLAPAKGAERQRE